MMFRIATLLLLSSPLLQYASAIEVSMIDMEDVVQHHHVVMDSSDPYGGSSYARGVSLIKSELKNLLMKTANQDNGASSMDPSEWHEVQTTFLTDTSKYHQDHKHNDGTLVEEEVGFVALNTNSDAYFDHPDMKVPIQEGAFIRFKGSDPHRTVVNKGSVHLLGPFDLKSFGKVGCRFLSSSDPESLSARCPPPPPPPPSVEPEATHCCSPGGGGCTTQCVSPLFPSNQCIRCFKIQPPIPLPQPISQPIPEPSSAPSLAGKAGKVGKAAKAAKAPKGGARKRLRN